MGKKKSADVSSSTEPKFPYTTAPSSLRKFLKLVPEKPKPTKFNQGLYKGWGLTDTNANTITRVLKALDLVSQSSEPTQYYEGFMHRSTGPAVLGARIRTAYSPLFQASHTPYSESDQVLQNLFNIHSGGGEATLKAQIQTFKALCEYATFDEAASPAGSAPANPGAGAVASPPAPGQSGVGIGTPSIHIDLHIHLPENKTSREYEAIIQDIAKYIYKHEVTGHE